MSTSYRLAQEHNLQTVLWAIAGAVHGAAVAVRSALPYLLYALCLLAKAVVLVTVVAGGAFLALTFWVVLAKLAVGLALIGLFALATYPRSAVRK